MGNIDYAVVYGRGENKTGSGTVVHFSSNLLVIEIYEKMNDIRLNEMFSKVRLSLGQVLFYNGKAVVYEIVDSSSIQLVTLVLRENCIAVGGGDSEPENQLAFERFISHHISEFDLPIEIERKLYQFSYFLSQLMAGLKVSRLKSEYGLTLIDSASARGSRTQIRVYDIGLQKLIVRYRELEKDLRLCTDEQRVQVGDFFKNYVFPVSVGSRIFRYFHSTKRSSYINYRTLFCLKSDQNVVRGNYRGYLLDEFFKSCTGFEDIERRSNSWVNDVREWLATHTGNMHLLLLGSDTTPFSLASDLTNEERSRLVLDMFCPTCDDPEEFCTEHFGHLLEDSEPIKFRLINEPITKLLQFYFRKKTGDFLSYDRIYSSSFIESLSSKTAAYIIAFCLNQLKTDGCLQFYSRLPEYSPVREHWLLWFDHWLDLEDWKRYLPFKPDWTQSNTDFGQLTIFNQTRMHREL